MKLGSSFRFQGRDLAAPYGSTVAGALLANGERAWRTTRTGGQRRGLFCGIGTCFDCLVELNGEKAVRACLMALKEGDEVGTFAGLASAGNGSIGNAGSPGSPGSDASPSDGSLGNGGYTGRASTVGDPEPNDG